MLAVVIKTGFQRVKTEEKHAPNKEPRARNIKNQWPDVEEILNGYTYNPA